ncbi:M13 family metallopeptidase [Aliidiomarina sedimenti]|uniref:M13 family metallopeptidase n=1 Tax=Aliidiomarina sedimenti TaxID=1933879 RepID=UPI001F545333|nr:M13-type metalloendopeptidase [Aliidiomarina sedimenti]
MITRTSLLALSVAMALGTAACSEPSSTDNDKQSSTVSSEYGELTSGVELENMDTSVRPQDDFFRYINGQWLERTDIPTDRARWGSFDELRERAEQQVLAIVKEFAEQDAEEGSDAQKIGDLYRSFLNEEQIEERGLSPLDDALARIDELESHDQLASFWGQQQRSRAGIPVALFVGQDQMQSDQYITGISQAGLGLPDRDYYVNDSESNQQLLQQYKAFIVALYEAAEWEGGEQAAETIVALESKLAQSQWSRVQNRDRQATYNKLTVDELAEQAPGFDWSAFFAAAEVDINEVVVRQPTYFADFAAMYDDVDLADWQTYLRFHTLRQSAEILPAAIADTSFDFYGRVLQGLEEQRDREKRGVSMVENALGFMVGEEYVARHYQEASAERMQDMIDNLMVAFEGAINDLEWMTDETKEEAQAKLSTFTAKIGYPSKWRDYDCLNIVADDLYGNMQRSSQCEYQRMIDRLGEEVDPDDWGMTPQTVNAYYRSTMNEIVFPAAILQPPFFNVEADDAVNYGAIGGVIGHEITHGFDDQGRRSDGEGNLRDWWSAEDESQFTERAQQMIDQYSAFNPIDDLQLQGALGLGENIADLGGLTVSYRAYQNSLNGEAGPEIDGMTAEQRFFAGWGQIWRIKFRDEALRRQVVQGPHSPGKYRVLGVLSNMPEFYEAYDVSEDDDMYRGEEVRVKIW